MTSDKSLNKTVSSSTATDAPLLYGLLLADDGSPENAKTYIRISQSKQGSILRFILEPGSLACRTLPTLHTTYPKHGAYDRNTHHVFPFTAEANGAHYCDIPLQVPGAFEYRVHWDDNQARSSGYFIVEPQLYTSDTSPAAPQPLDGLIILSLIPKWMGKLSEWQAHIQQAKRAGYNMIHFAPMQQRGSSDSPYSIRDQLLFADHLFDTHKLSRGQRAAKVKQVIDNMHRKDGILAISDVVWNHTSHDADFLLDHPEAGYNLHNSPHLTPAYELDSALLLLSDTLEQHGLPTTITSEKDVDCFMTHIEQVLIPGLKLWEYSVVDTQKAKAHFRKALAETAKIPSSTTIATPKDAATVEQQAIAFGQATVTTGHTGTRFHKTVDMARAVPFVVSMAAHAEPPFPKEDVDGLVTLFDRLLDDYNLILYQQYDNDMKAACTSIRNRIIYTRLAEHGPKLKAINASCPLVETYFTRLPSDGKRHPPGSMQLANNGWIWNSDPLQDFAGPDSAAYLRREVICWSDCVKLRYGASPDDNPWLWNHMRTYTQEIASIFQGFRIDNCHSTPIHVAEYLLDAARQIRPNLYVLAELFTGAEHMDHYFVSRLGIHALIREAMQAWNPHELSRLVHRHGGKPIGSMDQDLHWQRIPYHGQHKEALFIPIEHGSMARAVFMDCTHDNETPFQKRTAQDTLPNAAIVAFSDCAIGSVKGYDEVYPRLLDVAQEKRLYSPFLSHPVGIVDIKAKLHKLHMDLALEGYHEVHVHQEGDFIMVHRQHPDNHDGFLLVARTAFPTSEGGIAPVRLHKTEATFVFGTALKVDTAEANHATKYLTGLPNHLETLAAPPMVREKQDDGSWATVLTLSDMPPGAIHVLRTTMDPSYCSKALGKILTAFPDHVLDNFDVLDCNVVLYRSDSEERDATGGNGTYVVPTTGPMVYAGLEGFMAVLRPIIRNNDLGHPFCANLREGPWAMDYILHRLTVYSADYPHLPPFHEWLKSCFDRVRQLPTFLIPKYFSVVVQTAYTHVRNRALQLLSPLIRDGDTFIQSLGLCSVQLHALVPSTGLKPTQVTPSLAAGLPHFSQGYMRTWGRDVFISLRGLLLVTGQYTAAKNHILSFAATLKHGLIPNLLDSGRSPRYNARDATWWFMQAVQDYCLLVPDGLSILQARVARRFPRDDRYVPVEEGFDWDCSLAELLQEVMQRHAQGIHFREHNAGPAIDSQMKDAGFNVDIEVDWETGVLVGGNEWNCGTWMDKMGESERAGNKGFPGTSRDGAPIEITGLLKSTLRWLISLGDAFPWSGVQVNGREVTYKQWNQLLQDNVERVYYIPKDPSEDAKYVVDTSIVHRRGIYKDVYKATHRYTEYQLRPNLCVALAVAPELFDKDHARVCLDLVKHVLMGPLGMRTLDPADQRYRPYYINSDDSDDFDVAKGRNYHQGPEWLWPVGFFLRAARHFGTMTPHDIAHILLAHRKEIARNDWAGLPELTNKDGAVCWDSCTTQAWSASTLLDYFYDVQHG